MGNFTSKLKETKIVPVVVAVLLFITAILLPVVHIFYVKGQQVEQDIVFYPANSQKAVILAGGQSKNPLEMASMAKWLSQNNVNVASATYQEDSATFERAVLLMQEKGFAKEDMVIIGYDISGYHLLEHLSNTENVYGGAVLLSPYYQEFDESTISVNNTSYVNTIPWLSTIQPQSLRQPTALITTTLDDIASPVLCTVIYNHLSGDDILLSANTYSAEKDGVSFNVISGVNHLYVPYSRAIMENVSQFLGETMGWQVTSAPILPMVLLASWVLMPLCVIAGLFYIFAKVRYQFYTVSYSVQSYEKVKNGTILGYRVFATILAIPIAYIIYKILQNLSFSNPAQVVMIAYMFSVALVLVILLKFSKSGKAKAFFGKVNLKPNNKGLWYAIGLGALILLMFTVQHVSGLFSANIAPNLVTMLVVFLMACITFHVTNIEAEVLGNAKLAFATNCVYYFIKLAPYAILIIWNMFISRHTIALVYFRNLLVLCIVLALGRVFMEITGHRKLSAIIMALAFTIPVMIFTIPIV